MDIASIQKPVASSLDEAEMFAGIPEVTDITYDLWLLRITLHFENIDHPVYVVFDKVRGFRVLDEGDLLEFWKPDVGAKGWLWRVEKGGWFALESLREGFVSGSIKDYKEFLVLGQNECVSVIAYDIPKIEAPKP